jgi:hypothetical protein
LLGRVVASCVGVDYNPFYLYSITYAIQPAGFDVHEILELGDVGRGSRSLRGPVHI